MGDCVFQSGVYLMLVLSRKKNERISIGNGLVDLVIIDIRGDKVRIGIEAPKEMPVHRAEVQRAINRKKELQAEIAHADLGDPVG
jgi:carbon storage regulator